MSETLPPTWIELEGAFNARDLGGLPTDDPGRRTRAGVLLRADATDKATMSFINHVRRYGSQRRGVAADELSMWLRVVAAARLSEGFGGSYASWHGAVALHGI